jgi:hypothetical protein
MHLHAPEPENVDETGAYGQPKSPEPHWGSLFPEIPGHNPNPSFRTPQAQGLIAESGGNPRRQQTLDEQAAGLGGLPESGLVRPHLSPRRRCFSFSDSLPRPPRIWREASGCLVGSEQTATICGRA